MKTLILATLISLVVFASTAYTDLEVSKAFAYVKSNETKIDMVYKSLRRIENKVDRILEDR